MAELEVENRVAPAATKQPSKTGQWMVLVAAFLGWMFDGMEMGIFPIAARPAILDMMKITDKDPARVHALTLKNGTTIQVLAINGSSEISLEAAHISGGAVTTSGEKLTLAAGDVTAHTASQILPAELPEAGSAELKKIRNGIVAKWMGAVTALFLFGAAAGGLAFGWLGDKFGRVRAMTISVLVYSLFTGAGYFAQEPWHLGLFRFIAALGMGGEWSLGVALIMECWPEKHRPILAGLIGAAANVGFAIVGAMTIFKPVKADDWRWLMLTGAFPAILTFFIRLFVPESEKWQESVKKEESKGNKTSPVVEIFSGALLSKTLLAIVFASVALVGTWGSVQQIPAWVDQFSKDPSHKSWAQLVLALGAIVGSLVAPLFGNLLGRRWTYFLLCVSSLAVCAWLFNGFNSFSNSFLVVCGLAGGLTAAFYGWLPLYLPELFPTRVRATGQGLCFNFGRIFTGIAVLNMGTIIGYYNGNWGQMCSFISMVYVFGMLFIWLAPETKGKPLPE
ncbi:MAG TPA: MFS transporter [Planctomycetota bacterium]|nr:MFS transporter [Planctomycetota bacterium]